MTHVIVLRFEIDTGDVIPAGIDMAVEIAILIQIVRVQGISLAENLFYHPDIVPYIGLRVFIKENKKITGSNSRILTWVLSSMCRPLGS